MRRIGQRRADHGACRLVIDVRNDGVQTGHVDHGVDDDDVLAADEAGQLVAACLRRGNDLREADRQRTHHVRGECRSAAAADADKALNPTLLQQLAHQLRRALHDDGHRFGPRAAGQQLVGAAGVLRDLPAAVFAAQHGRVARANIDGQHIRAKLADPVDDVLIFFRFGVKRTHYRDTGTVHRAAPLKRYCYHFICLLRELSIVHIFSESSASAQLFPALVRPAQDFAAAPLQLFSIFAILKEYAILKWNKHC